MNTGIKAIIVEDKESYLLTIETLVKDVAPYVTIAGKTTSLKEARKLIENISPDLLFLDIEFEKEGLTAFDLLSQLGKRQNLNFNIIFISAHREINYLTQAFNYRVLHFLEKPIDKEKLKEAIERMKINIPRSQDNDWAIQVAQMQQRLQSERGHSKIILEGIHFTEMADVKDIVFLEACGRYTEFTFSWGKKFIACQNLGEFEKKLACYDFFFRIHHSKIVNLNYIRRFSKKERIFEMIDNYGNHIASKDRFRDFMKYIESNNFTI